MSLQSDIFAIFNGVLSQRGVLRKAGMQATYYCPICHHYKRKLEIAIGGPDIGKYHCWVCHFRGNTFGSLLTNLKAPAKYRDAIFKLTGDIRVTRKRKERATPNSLELPSEFQSLATPTTSLEYRNALCYLTRRGISQEDIIRYNIGYCEDGEYGQHIIIPSYDAKGLLNFFIGRRYYYIPGTIPFKKPNVPMEIVGFESFVNYKEPIILVEAAFNAITIRRNAIPMFGKYPSQTLCEALITNKVETVYVCLDADAEKEAMRVCEKLIKLGIDPYFVKIDGGKDPNDIGFEATWSCIRKAVEVDFSTLLAHRLNL